MTDKKDVMKKAVGLARVLTENEHDPAVLDVVEAGIDSATEIADGKLNAEDLDRQIAESIGKVFRHVERGGPLWDEQLAATEKVLMLLSEQERSDLWRRTAWGDVDDHPALAAPAEAERWDEPTPALSEPLADEQPSPAAEPDEPEADDSGDEDVIDAEIVEVSQTTSSQRRYKVQPGGYGPPGVTNPLLSRSISGRRQPIIEIGGEAADW
ncbi:hypothetical protein BJF87_04060 [Gordonia sp. CNJ-863]|uniref:hypothetical protein n=1 Tax=Gordonia sp. CNJ-863 TaxID=1904963 RepID=UPI00096A2033|nr:hypothetical protein [Gordonia sp. CNJ-863]OLT47426.1 hypothetical protein BJF87_04060 [Gordonia sp. CNJ-863]